MKLLSLFSSKPNQPPKSKEQLDQEAKDEAEVQAAYDLAKKIRRIENAKQKGVMDADKLANQKPFYQKVIGAASAIGKDLMQASSNVNPDALITFNEPEPQRQHRKKKRRQTEEPYNPYPLF